MSKQDVMREFGKLVAANDLEGAAAYYTEDAVVHIDGTGPLTCAADSRMGIAKTNGCRRAAHEAQTLTA